MIMELLQKRRSIRKYTDEAIPDEKLDRILQAGLLAPSSRSLFPVEFITVRDRDMLQQLSRVKTMGSGMLAKADAAIVIIGDKVRSDAWIEDCSIAATFMQLAATEMGIGSCWVQCRGRVSQQKVSSDAFLHELLGIPEQYEAEAVLALGIPDREPKPHALPTIRELKVHRERY